MCAIVCNIALVIQDTIATIQRLMVELGRFGLLFLFGILCQWILKLTILFVHTWRRSDLRIS